MRTDARSDAPAPGRPRPGATQWDGAQHGKPVAERLPVAHPGEFASGRSSDLSDVKGRLGNANVDQGLAAAPSP